MYTFTIMHSSFFFYHNMKNHVLLREISPNFQAKKGTILVDHYDPVSGNITLGTMEELEGQLVSFNEDPLIILHKLNAMHNQNQIPGKTRYVVDTVLVNVGGSTLKKAYIIY